MVLIKGLRIGCWFGIGLLIMVGIYLLGTRLWTGSGVGTKSATQVQEYDLDQDGRTETYMLKDKQLSVTQDGQEIWRSPADWQVTAFVLADATNDGLDDLLLVVWKAGSFGRDKPFWVKEEDTRLSNHLFVLNLRQGLLKQVWFSSALDRPIQRLTVQDIDRDGKNELVVQEEELAREGRAGWNRLRDQVLGFPGSVAAVDNTTYWQWQSWGFYRLDVSN